MGTAAAAATARAGDAVVNVANKESEAVAVALAVQDKGTAAKVLAGGLENWRLGLDINDATLKDWIDAGRDLELIDVRTPAEYEAERIPGCINRPIDQIDQ